MNGPDKADQIRHRIKAVYGPGAVERIDTAINPSPDPDEEGEVDPFPWLGQLIRKLAAVLRRFR